MSENPPPYASQGGGGPPPPQSPTSPPPPYAPSYTAQAQYPPASGEKSGFPPPQEPMYPQGGYPPPQQATYPPAGYPPPQPPYPQSQPYPPPPQPYPPGPYPPAGPGGKPYPDSQGHVQPAGYHQVPGGPGTPTTTVIVQSRQRPPNYIWLSCVVYWCCNWLLGAIAFGLSMASNSAADEGNMEQARSLGKTSLYVNIAGIIITVVLIIIIVAFLLG